MRQSTCDALVDEAKPPVGLRGGVFVSWWGAASIAAFATWVLYGARPGINLLLCVLPVVLLTQVLEPEKAVGRRLQSLTIDATVLILSGSFAVSAGGPITGLVGATVVWLCALSVAQRAGQALVWRGLAQLLAMPITSLRIVLSEAAGRAGDAVRALRGGRYVSTMRGMAWALPTVLVFFVLLADADPTFESWRSQACEALRNLTFLPRLAFWLVLSLLLLGRLSLSAWSDPAVVPNAVDVRRRVHRSATERCIALGSIALLFTVFLVLQMNVLFGNLAARGGSGVTFAQSVHRGSFELTVVVTLTALLILVLGAGTLREKVEGSVRLLSLVLLSQCLLMLVSAWIRLLAYEQAYGYSMLRMYLHAYMVWVGFGLALLACEVHARIDTRRVVRRAAIAAVAGLCTVAYANVPANVVKLNVTRYQHGSSLDRDYLVKGGGLDALPMIEQLLPRLALEDRSAVLCLIQHRYGPDRGVFRAPEEWFEWNLRRRAARESLARLTVKAQDCVTPDGER